MSLYEFKEDSIPKLIELNLIIGQTVKNEVLESGLEIPKAFGIEF